MLQYEEGPFFTLQLLSPQLIEHLFVGQHMISNSFSSVIPRISGSRKFLHSSSKKASRIVFHENISIGPLDHSRVHFF